MPVTYVQEPSGRAYTFPALYIADRRGWRALRNTRRENARRISYGVSSSSTLCVQRDGEAGEGVASVTCHARYAMRQIAQGWNQAWFDFILTDFCDRRVSYSRIHYIDEKKNA